jgi:glycosyltransferase involved in cell wall biosynthesis
MKTGFFGYLPSGGAVRVAGHQLYHLRKQFDWTVYLPEGGAPLLPEAGVSGRQYSFPHGKRLKGVLRLAAPFLLWRKALSYRRLSRSIAEDILRDGCVSVLAHSSLIISSPPLLSYLECDSVYYCHEYPRYIYEQGIHKTGSALSDLLIAPLLAWERKVDRQSALDAGIIATNSSFMAKKLRSVYGREVTVVNPGVDTEVFTPSDDSREGFVLTVGALSEFKRHDLAVKALALIAENIRPKMVTVADRGNQRYADYLEALAGKLRVSLRIMRGISDERLISLYRKAAVVVCPQRNEPYGLVPLEAMACGTPVVAVDQGGFRENVMDGTNGLLVPPDPMRIAEAVESVVSDPKYAYDLGSNGREYVVSNRSSLLEAERIAILLKETAEIK